MTAFYYLYLHGIVDYRPYVTQLFAYLGERTEHVQLRYGRGSLLYFTYIFFYLVSDAYENLVLHLIYLGFGVENQIFHFFQLRSDESLGVGESLLSYVVFRYEVEI